MKRSSKLLVLTILLTGCFITPALSKGLGTLIEAGESQSAMFKDSKKETSHYNNVKNAIREKEIEIGQKQKFIKRYFGEPVIIMTDEKDWEKWAYKPAGASWFDNIKICLFFDENGILKEIKSYSGQSSSK